MVSALTHAQTLSFFSRSSSPKTLPRSPPAMSASVVRVAIVGDVHDDWDIQEDAKALQLLKPDLVLFTGDFGNENVELVRSVADLDFPKAVILGNHDSWKTHEFSGKKKDGVQLQLEWIYNCLEVNSKGIIISASQEIVAYPHLERQFIPIDANVWSCLAEEHVAYRRLDFPASKLSIVGGRPFSCGGQQIFRKRLLSARYGVQDMNGSAKRIYKAALDTPEDHFVILLAHNGPTGLGSDMNDICGKDWGFGGGDHGDPDLAQAISLLKETTKLCIPLVVFGHMHKELAYGNGLRKMIMVGSDSTIYLNGAIVPRVKRLIGEQGTDNRSFMNGKTSFYRPNSEGTIRAFTVVEILDGRVDRIAESWVTVVGDTTTLKEEHVLIQHSS